MRITTKLSLSLAVPLWVAIACVSYAAPSDVDAKADAERLRGQAAKIAELADQVREKGLDMAYPQAYKTLFAMFADRTKGDVNAANYSLVVENAAHLDKVFAEAKPYLEGILADPSKQLKMPPAFDPAKLNATDGYFRVDGRPVFLWGPSTFWFMRASQAQTWELGFNFVNPEIIMDPRISEHVKTYMEAYRTNGIVVNAVLRSPDFAEFSRLHPDAVNKDENVSMDYIVQEPLSLHAVKAAHAESIDYLKTFPAVRFLSMWNEPDYLNFSERTRLEFIERHLERRYGDVAALNEAWGTELKSFREVQLPRGPEAGHAAWGDYDAFRNALLVDFFTSIYKADKSRDPSRMLYIKYTPASVGLMSVESQLGAADVNGFGGGATDRDIIFHDYIRSVDPGRAMLNSTVHFWYRDQRRVELVPWRLALHGMSAGNWWSWHANYNFSEPSGHSYAMWGLAKAGLDLRRLFDPYIVALESRQSPVATLFPDVVRGVSGPMLDALRFELGPAQYSLGMRPHYVTEDGIDGAQGIGSRRILAAAGATMIGDAAYGKVLAYVQGGGSLLATPDSFSLHGNGAMRDASELIKPGEGEEFCDGAKTYTVGNGKVVLMQSEKAVGIADRESTWRRMLAKTLEQGKLLDPVRIAPSDGAPLDSLAGLDWRSAEVAGGHVLCILPADFYEPDAKWNVRLVAGRPVKRIVDLITGEEVAPASFKVEAAPNLFLVELQ